MSFFCRWRHKEAALYMLQQIVEEFKGEERVIKDELINACVEHVRTTMGDGMFILLTSLCYF